jgi:hypothetical protein
MNGTGGTITISGGTIAAYGNYGAGIGGGSGQVDNATVIITGGSVKMSNSYGPRPTNGYEDVYLNTLTIGNVGDNVLVTAGRIDGVECIDGAPDASAGEYGIHDVITRDGGKVYFYLPATGGDEKGVLLKVEDGTEYAEIFERVEDDTNQETLITEELLVVSAAPTGYDAPIDGNVTITFNQKMSAEQTNATVKLNDDVLDLSAASWTSDYIVEVPYTELANGTTYVIRIAGFEDKAGRTVTPVTSNTYSFVTLHSYEASVDQAAWDFGVEDFGYAPVAPQAFVVENTGTGTLTNLQARLLGADAAAFEITTNLAATLASGSEATVSVRPVSDLPYSAMAYRAILEVTGNNGILFSIPILFEVEKAVPKLEYLDYTLPDDLGEGVAIYDGIEHDVAVTAKTEYASHLGAITVKYNGSVDKPVKPGIYAVTIELTEGANYTSGTFDIDVLIIYELLPPPIPRWVTIEPTPYFDVDPEPGSFVVMSGSNLVLTLTPRPSLPEGYAPRVTTNRTIYADKYPSGIKITANDDGTYSVQIAYIIEETVITIAAVSPSSGDGPTANDSPAAADVPQVWGYGGRLYIRSATPGRAAVYNLSGQQVKSLPFAAGETLSHPLPAGIYVVRLDDGKSYKVVLH